MDLLTIVLIAVGLAMDCFAVSLAAGTSARHHRLTLAVSLATAFGLFQFSMTVAGWAAGEWLLSIISSFDHWIAFLILTVIGGKMILEGIWGKEEAVTDYLNWGTLLLLSLATSMDALGVGLSLALLNVDIGISGIIIGLVSFLFSFCGVFLGSHLAKRLGRSIEILGGVILVVMGIRILFSHIFGGTA